MVDRTGKRTQNTTIRFVSLSLPSPSIHTPSRASSLHCSHEVTLTLSTCTPKTGRGSSPWYVWVVVVVVVVKRVYILSYPPFSPHSSFFHPHSLTTPFSPCHGVTHCSVSPSLSCPLHHSLLIPHLFIPTHTPYRVPMLRRWVWSAESIRKPHLCWCALPRRVRRRCL
jgi:hypothetical protein